MVSPLTHRLLIGLAAIVSGLTLTVFLTWPAMPVNAGNQYADTTWRCTSDHASWQNSEVYNAAADWNIMFMPQITAGQNETTSAIFTDLNGDGLTDYAYLANHNQPQACVYLSNGTGWDLVFRCYVDHLQGLPDPTRYYGDCAQI